MAKSNKDKTMLDNLKSPTRRQLLTMIGKIAGGAAMYSRRQIKELQR